VSPPPIARGSTSDSSASSTLEEFAQRHKAKIDADCKAGWKQEHAEAIELLTRRRGSLAKELREAANRLASGVASHLTSVRFRKCQYALCEAVYCVAKDQQKQQEERQGSDAAAVPLADAIQDAVNGKGKVFYKHLRGQYSLVEMDDSWGRIEGGDVHGFRGFTSYAATEVNHEEKDNFTKDGFAQRITDASGNFTYVPQESDVVCFLVQVCAARARVTLFLSLSLSPLALLPPPSFLPLLFLLPLLLLSPLL